MITIESAPARVSEDQNNGSNAADANRLNQDRDTVSRREFEFDGRFPRVIKAAQNKEMAMIPTSWRLWLTPSSPRAVKDFDILGPATRPINQANAGGRYSTGPYRLVPLIVILRSSPVHPIAFACVDVVYSNGPGLCLG